MDLTSSSRVVEMNFSMPDNSLNLSQGLNPNPALYSGPKKITFTQGILSANETCCTHTGL